MKRKGFTLVELLAVIVVLAIIALISVPTVLGVIEKSRKAAFKDSVYGIMDATEFYMATNLGMESGTFICNGKICSINDGKQKLNFKGEVPESGTVIIEKDKIRVSFLSNGKYCANGTRETLEISDDCTNLDETAPEIDKTKLSYTSTTNSVTIYFNGYAIDKETGIKEYEVTLNNETKTVAGSEERVTFNKLTQDKEYEAIIKVKNKNNKETMTKIITKTLLINEPIIDASEHEPEEALNGYYSSQTIKVTYNQEEKGRLRYFIKTTRNGVSNIEVTKSCGTETTPGECEEIESTKVLEANKWYEVDNDLEVTYTEASEEAGTLTAVIYDEANNSTYANGTVEKIRTTANYTVNHYVMNVSGSGYTLQEVEILNGKVGENVTPDVKTYTGFTSPNTESTTVKFDESSVVNYYYERNQYTVTLDKGTGIESVSGAGNYYYGASVTVSATASSGYKFSSWTGDKTTATFTMPASNVTMKANAVSSVTTKTVTKAFAISKLGTTTVTVPSGFTTKINSISSISVIRPTDGYDYGQSNGHAIINSYSISGTNVIVKLTERSGYDWTTTDHAVKITLTGY